jgi:hypothetical protein
LKEGEEGEFKWFGTERRGRSKEGRWGSLNESLPLPTTEEYSLQPYTLIALSLSLVEI